ncbi:MULTISPECIES: glycosyltransferase [Rhizobium]|jgi:glycosyltransferase involved in cell wall biosynthesis|uniref:Glycosyltransferase n=1 Tax=Rhizobium anhuiense TaxID=1184720 RepID=A0A3S0RZ87_9HYPH|nr:MULTISPECIES: glycosyltransferase [Rhizobium]MBB3299206.1 glycosyltransferase involved in cell wall biosynthesis [Rhizobium sp. BK112]MBB3368071.1 glycosyltransferase involved in cell wall biosynthesis [Rhizobium sp. BK077]MBB3744380.1 glycosyltransferase involved in cell wall biosynthesis [Rhizobium sp. BK591]MBB4114274.1 glycosyltransferase involved in cell wall biosynthesis [Rhizobium sp. BK226]MBB4178973.1 glycosyltransferase involved in cell wall biosynthesis [Rhizobium sp. BK109]
MARSRTDNLNIAVLLPCYNEAATIGPVVRGFRATLPDAAIHVYDNNSTDGTALQAMLAGAHVVRERRQGKGHVVRRMFADIEADIYIIADGDGTYTPDDAEELVRTLLTERADMVVGTRRGVHDDAGRQGHALGNRLFNLLYRTIFGPDFTDIFSGYRAFSRRFVKSFPAVSGGFEIETEMSVHASRLKLPVSELELDYGRRPEGSHSKLSTFRDGAKILWMFAMLMKETRPFAFFSAISATFMLASLGFMAPVLAEYFQTGLVSRMPTWVLSTALMMISFMLFTAGVILDSVARARAEQLRIHYIGLETPSAMKTPLSHAAPVSRAGRGKADAA